MKHFLFYFNILIFSLTSSFAQESVKGKVIEVYSGDTYKVKVDTFVYWVRLSGVDCPLKADGKIFSNQEFSKEVTEQVQKFVLNKEIVLQEFGRTKDNKVEVLITIENLDLTKLLVQNGLGILSKTDYIDKPTFRYYKSLQKAAKVKRMGIWISAKTISPKRFARSHSYN